MIQHITTYQGMMCIPGTLLIISDQNPEGIINFNTYKSLVKRNRIKVVKRACYGNPALVEISSMPQPYKQEVFDLIGGDPEKVKIDQFIDRIESDPKAIEFFETYELGDGLTLKTKHNGIRYIKEYCKNASVLNTIKKLWDEQSIARFKQGENMRNFWPTQIKQVNEIREAYGHKLPTSMSQLKRVYDAYLKDGYEAILSKRFCNSNTRKVDQDIAHLLMSLYSMSNNPFLNDVYSKYLSFLRGEIQLVDRNSGELFDPENFRDSDGNFITISKTTVHRVLNNPLTRVLVDSKRMNQHAFNGAHRPHHHRKAPEYSFSKISLDDVDLSKKMFDGNRAKAYYAYDDVSGCIVGYAHSEKKDEDLFINCLRDLFRFIDANNLPMPLEAEVEHHLVSKYFEELGNIFKYFRICNAGNSQEKIAEQRNRSKKYGANKQLNNGIGRWYARHEAYRTYANKEGDEYVEKKYPFAKIVAEDVEAIKFHNNSEHPNFKDKSRLQVLLENIHPDAAPVDKPTVYRFIGEMTKSTIVRNQYAQVQYKKWWLPQADIIKRLKSNDYEVKAYYLTDYQGNINEVYFFQDDKFLCKSNEVGTYNRAKAEWENGKDDVSLQQQSSFVNSFDKMVKQGKEKISKLEIIKTEDLKAAVEVESKPIQIQAKHEESVDDLLNGYNSQEYIEKAQNSL
jgi:hypothetical protein